MSAPSPELLVRFRGTVRCERRPAPLGLVLNGAVEDGQPAVLAFVGAAPADLPPSLDAPAVYRTLPAAYRLESGEQRWSLAASAVFLHRDVGAAFFQAVPPRRAPWRRRLLWSALLMVAGSAPGRRWLEGRSRR